MSNRHFCRTSAAVSFLFFAFVLSTAIADPSTRADATRGAQRPERISVACRTIDRPKYSIRKCACTPSALANVGSIDAAEILRLLTGDRGCQSQPPPQTPESAAAARSLRPHGPES